MLNSVVMMGRLTADPELRTTPNGVSVCSFTIAVDRPHQRSGAERVTDFFDCVAWRSNAEFVSRYFHKGNLICVQGYMTVRPYQDKNGNNRRAYEIVVDAAHFVESKRDAAASAAPAPAAQNNAPAAAYSSGDAGDFVEIPGDDDLPF
ncbi:MAG: single-stranded DNA-binding protein [Firmicutes bacterium]|nr:single-stranded DNA-binding protein [Bacillota bacterium]